MDGEHWPLIKKQKQQKLNQMKPDPTCCKIHTAHL